MNRWPRAGRRPRLNRNRTSPRNSANALAEIEKTARHAAAAPIPQVGDKVTYTASTLGTVFEISRVSNDGREVDLHLPGTNMERFRVYPDELTFVERRVPARASEPAKPPFNAVELTERIATVQHSAIEHLRGEVAILKKFLKSKRAPEGVLDVLDDLCRDTEKIWSTGVAAINKLLEE